MKDAYADCDEGPGQGKGDEEDQTRPFRLRLRGRVGPGPETRDDGMTHGKSVTLSYLRRATGKERRERDPPHIFVPSEAQPAAKRAQCLRERFGCVGVETFPVPTFATVSPGAGAGACGEGLGPSDHLRAAAREEGLRRASPFVHDRG